MATPNTVNSTVPMPPVSGRVTPLLFSTVMTGTVVPCALALFTFQDSRMPVFSSYVAEMGDRDRILQQVIACRSLISFTL